MKKICSICLVVLVLGMISGCATKYPETDTVYIQKNGTVQEATVESFDKEYYKEEELKEFITAEIEEYEGTYEKGSVKLKDFLVEEGMAKLMMNYDGYQSYMDFNGRELFAGTIVQAIAAGYSFSGDFLEVKDGQTVGGSVSDTEGTEGSQTVTEAVDGSAVTAEDDCKVVVINEDTDVVVKGTIRYVSAGSVTVKDKNTVSVKTVNDGVSYIVYK